MSIQQYADIVTALVANYQPEIKVAFIFVLCIGLAVAAYTEEL